MERLETYDELHLNKLAGIIISLSNIRAKIKDNIITDDPTIVSSLLEIESRLVKWDSESPAEWVYTVVPSSEVDSGYWDRYHIYRHVWMAASWNYYRCARILVNEGLLNHASRAFASASLFTPMEYHIQCCCSRGVLYQMSSDICASVSWFKHDQREGSDNVPKGASSFLLLWPLYVAGAMDGADNHLRTWVIRQLEIIGSDLGVRQALALAKTLK